MNLFGTAGVRGSAEERVTPELALDVARAVGAAAREADDREFVVGRDGRVTGPALASAVEAGLESAGADVLRVGQVPTPALAFASRGRRGVMLTASHNPSPDNGIKLFVDGVEYGGPAEDDVEARVAAGTPPARWDEWGDATRDGVLADYRDAVTGYAAGFGADPDGVRVAVDCGNGMASVVTPQVLRELGADVVTLNANVDGHFPGRGSKPTAETLSDLRAFVRGGGADLGVAHDGDADRLVVVDADGELVHEDTVVAILAERYVRSADADDPVVVTTPNASGRIDERVEAAGGRVERVALGYLHDGIAAAREAGGDVVFAAEPWKHVHPAFGGWIDGVVSAAVVTRLVAESGLAALRDPVTERPYRKESVSCPDDAKEAVMARVGDALPAAFPDADVDTEYGVRLTFPDASWTLVRPSGTEPYVRVYAESDEVEALADEVSGVVADAVADEESA
ncbi:phosphomannomutase [Candidatus Halobonum tyrrellensis]|uniref:Phosphomannomutase n=1 Tax=Candidatus Halobonum tyrrellensis G22 TaxID=1324957 RepID=V4GU05_9EURY|nr:phosphomannomutase [Candidatus Halobonum tyrrellensis]ESP88611.1 phosphomannomutase [Candidatus Halobonum tyrrellensis G22]